MWLLWDLRAPSTRPAHPQETTPILIHTHTHMHTDPQVYSSQAGVHIHKLTYQHSYTQEHMLAYTWHFKRKYGKSMLKISKNFLIKKKSDLRKNLIIVFLPPLWFLPFLFSMHFSVFSIVASAGTGKIQALMLWNYIPRNTTQECVLEWVDSGVSHLLS